MRLPSGPRGRSLATAPKPSREGLEPCEVVEAELRPDARAVATNPNVLAQRGPEQVFGLTHRLPLLRGDPSAARPPPAGSVAVGAAFGVADRPPLGCGLLRQAGAAVLIADLEDRP